MKSSTIKQLIENYIYHQNSNKEIVMKKLPTQTNHNIKKNIQKDLNNSSIKTRRKPKYFNTKKNFIESNKKKLKSCSRYKNTQNNQNYKYKDLIKYSKPNMNRTICTTGYGNIITNTHDRNLSAPSLNYEKNLYYHKNKLNKKKKNNVIKLNKADKKLIDENLINRDNYLNHIHLDINSVKDNNTLDITDDKSTSINININNKTKEVNKNNSGRKDEFYDALLKVKKIEKEENNFANIQKNNLNIKNYYKNKINKKKNDNNNKSKIDLSTYIKDIETIKNARESIAILKEQLKQKDNKNNLNTSINNNQINNLDNKKAFKKNNGINLNNKSGYVISNFHKYNKYTINKKNKSKNYINKTNIFYNDINNISKDLTPSKQIANTTRENIDLSNSSNNKAITISTNITNNINNFGKKINLSINYGEAKDKEKNYFQENNIQKEEENIINNENQDNIHFNKNNLNNNNQCFTERNKEENNIKDSNINNDTFRVSNNNFNDNKINNISQKPNKKNSIANNNNKNIDNNKKLNYLYLKQPNKKNNSNKETNSVSLNIKKNNNNIKEKNNNKDKKDNKKQIKLLNNNNKKKNISKKTYNNDKVGDLYPLSSRFHTINSERFNNFNDIQKKNKKGGNNNDTSFDIGNKIRKDLSKIKQKQLSHSKEKIKNNEKPKIKEKLSDKPYINNTDKSGDIFSEEKKNESPNKERINLDKVEFKYKSIYKIGVICEAGEVVFGEKKTNQDNYFNSLIKDDLRFIGVCDGHGEFGHHVSKYLRNNLPNQFLKSLERLYKKEESIINLLQKEMSGYCNSNKNSQLNIEQTDNEKTKNNCVFEKIKKVFEKSFSKTDKNLSQFCKNLQKNENSSENEEKEENYFNVEYSGSTCVSILLKDQNINKIYIANVGDSRAIIIKELQNKNWSSYQLSRDHKPTEEDEAQRVLDYGGEIEQIEDDDGNWTGPLRVWVKGSDGPGLAMTRSFGDEIGATVGVVSVPEVGEYQIKEEDRAIIIASDGLWEYMNNEDVTDIIKKQIGKNDPDLIVNELYKKSINRWMLKDQGIDDITIICILLNTC